MEKKIGYICPPDLRNLYDKETCCVQDSLDGHHVVFSPAIRLAVYRGTKEECETWLHGFVPDPHEAAEVAAHPSLPFRRKPLS